MATCANCNTFILFGGKHLNGQTYCNDRCLQVGRASELSARIDPAVIREEVDRIFNGVCPKCSGHNGPVDVRKSHEVFSALIFTRWSTQMAITCKSCARKKQLGAMLFSGLAGWWGFPWGLVMTPVQIVRNGVEIFSKDSQAPSAALERVVRVQIGSQVGRSTPPPLPKMAAQ